MNFITQNLHLIIVCGVVVAAVLFSLMVLAVAVRRISKAPKFALWLDEIFSDENGKGSNQRFSRFMALFGFEFGWVWAVIVLIQKAQYASVVGLFVTHATMISAFYGLNVVDNITKKTPIAPFPDLPKPPANP